MKHSFTFELIELHKNIAKMTINGETAGFIITPLTEHDRQSLFLISHNGKELGYQDHSLCAFDTIIRHYERLSADIDIELINRRRMPHRIDIDVNIMH